ncbi:MAG: PaaI family thioesterase [Actinomycetota bacterium]
MVRSEVERAPIWREPVRGGYADRGVLGFDGLERMRLTIAGRLPAPPIHHLTGLTPVDAAEGSSTFSMPASPWWRTPAGLFSAGTMAFLADAPLGSAIVTASPPGQLIVTSDLSMSYLRPASTDSGELVGRARLIHAGKRVALSEINVEDARGRLLAHGTTRCFLFEPLRVPPEPPDAESLEPYRPRHETPDPWQREPLGEVVPQEVWDERSGLEVSRAMIAGELPPPPVHHFTGGRFTEVEEGRAVFVQPATEWLNSPARAMYGGAIAWIVDIALSGAVHTTVPARSAFAPLDLKVNFVRPVFPDMRDLTAEATVTHRGRSLVVASCELRNADGKPVALGTGSSVVLPDRRWSGPEVAPEDEAPSVDEDAEPS